MDKLEVELRSFEPNDKYECHTLFRRGMMEVIPSLYAIEVKGYLKCALFLVPVIALTLTWSLRDVIVLLCLCAIIAALVYIHIYFTMTRFIHHSLSDDLQDVAKVYQDGSCMFVAVLNGAIVGMAGVLHNDQHKPGHAEVLRMSVNPSIRKRGIATKLLKAIEHFCNDNNYTKLTLKTTSGQYAAMALYEKNGFKEIRRQQPAFFVHFIKQVMYEKMLTQRI
ncbi:N-acetylaspartate synthetase [Exaiptasia diaphana]|uniref:N-acetyltransferase domain-containing protein n=1 Tax=Exaiptasia diaphana TaxID=2652724 RepID=A0A913YLP2_EXADI|nr:N-acetylaspartate synthetase [Exaiptasia diaphana]